MYMEERYRLIISTIFNAIGFDVEVEKMLSTGRIDAIVKTSILGRQYLASFEADKRKVIGLAIELDNKGKGLIDWQKAESEQQGEF